MPDDTTISLSGTDLPDLPSDMVHGLLFMTGPDAGKRVELGQGNLVVGRREDADVPIRDRGVSGRHCRVIAGGRVILVEDLGSTNGTWVDRVRVRGLEPFPVGSILQVGSTLLTHECRSREDLAREERLESELKRACEYVLSLLPPPVETGPVRAFWRFIPSVGLGGDAFGYHWLDRSRFAVYLLDVCGHGARAALHSVSVVNVLRRKALRGVDFTKPEEVLEALNQAFPMEEFAGMYFTVWYGVYEVESRTLTFSSGGHPPALLLPGDGGDPVQLRTRGPGVGMLEDPAYRSDEARIEPGSRLYLYSDGAYEIRTDESRYWSLDDLLSSMASDPEPGVGELDRIEGIARRVGVSEGFEDDFSLLIVDFPRE
jgi:hypothetical protein